MRQLRYLSYSGFCLFESDPEGFYRRYLSENRPPREPQNHYMAIGSAFDAFVKAELHKRFVGDNDPKYQVDTLFDAQVEPQCRDRARTDGAYLYDQYKKSGAFADLCEDMRGCINPRFEFDIETEITHPQHAGGVKFLGKPDIAYISREGARVIHDFKCNGFYSKSPPSPKPGYVTLFPQRGMHRLCAPMKHKGFQINGGAYFHHNLPDWSQQLSFYAWGMGEEIGSDYILSIDQIVTNMHTKVVRVAKHGGICSDVWQHQLFARLHRCWYACANGHVFLNMPYDASVARCGAIDAELASCNNDPMFRELTRER